VPSVGTGETPTLSTLDFYMARLHGAIERDPAQHERLIVRIKEILAQVARCVPAGVQGGLGWQPSPTWPQWGSQSNDPERSVPGLIGCGHEYWGH
jgi:hypothetical protein